jgi:hypothetical protein
VFIENCAHDFMLDAGWRTAADLLALKLKEQGQ